MEQVPTSAAHVATVTHSLISRLLPVVKIGLLLISIGAAIPTARNLYYSWAHGIPFSQVAHRLDQYDLWMKNLECNIDYRALNTANGNKVDVGACPTTGDIAIKITSAAGHSAYEWIAFDQLQKPVSISFNPLQLLISSAFAGDGAPIAPAEAGGRIQLAQVGMQVVCQARRGDRILRVIKEGNKCFREVFSPLRARVEEREEVGCNTRC